MIAIVKWYLYALYLRLLRFRDRLFRHRSMDTIDSNLANSLFMQFDSVAGDIPHKERIRNSEFKVFSQQGEDGILACIFSDIGVTNKTFLEFGITDGRECNTANLSINFGWNGLLLEGDPNYARAARDYYQSIDRFGGLDVKVVECFVSKENINGTIAGNGMTGEIDLLSIDIDGNDYWIWEEIDVINPRVVIMEYNASLGRKAITVKYDPDFSRFKQHRSGWYHGASLCALAKLGEKKGYDLVCADSAGVNGFFVRKDVVKHKLETLSAEEAFYPQRKRLKVATEEQQFDVIKHLDFVEV